MKYRRSNTKDTANIDLSTVSGSVTPNFLKVAVDELLTYRTPKKIIDYIEDEKMKSIIGNPPYDVSEHYRQR